MAETILNRLKHAWNAFREDTTANAYQNVGPGYSIRPDRLHLRITNERSIISSIYTRIAMDVASVSILHVRVDQNGRYLEQINSGLNECLTLQSNIDQVASNFMQDVVLSMFDEGCVAIVPVETSINPAVSTSYDILSLRTAKIVEWFPRHVRLYLYDDRRGIKDYIILPKKDVAIIENPLYSIMNEPNSTLKRLVHKLNLLDAIDDQSGSGKLDLIIQLPYVVKTQARQEQAEKRHKDIEDQLAGSKYGIAYIDATEKVTQLNRPTENNLMKQIEFLTSMLYSQLGITSEILEGKADEKVMINYYSRTVDPILTAIVDAMKPKFLTKTGRTQGQSLLYIRDPFKLVPATELATIADTFTRNAILTSNEVRGIIGYKPVDDADADALRNKNLNPAAPVEENQNGSSDEESDL